MFREKVLIMRLKLRYYEELYLGESIDAQKLEKIKKKLETRPLFSGIFVISISRNPSDQLDIYEAKQLVQRYYQKNPPYIIGITKSKEEAIAIVQQIVEECMDARGDCSLKEYLKC